MDIVTLGAALNGSAEYVNSHFKGGSNIQIVDNPDGTQTINASGEVSSEDTVARAEIAEMKDGENLDSFGDVETALGDKADTSTTYTKTEVDTALSGKQDALSAEQLSAVNSGITSADVAQIETNKTNILYNTNNGVKNLYDYANSALAYKSSSCTATKSTNGISVSSSGTWAFASYPMTLKSGTYKLVCTVSDLVIEGGQVRITIGTNAQAAGEALTSFSVITNGEKISDEFTIQSDSTVYLILYINQSNQKNSNSMIVSNIMIIHSNIDDTSYQPYAMSNSELTAALSHSALKSDIYDTEKESVSFVIEGMTTGGRPLSSTTRTRTGLIATPTDLIIIQPSEGFKVRAAYYTDNKPIETATFDHFSIWYEGDGSDIELENGYYIRLLSGYSDDSTVESTDDFVENILIFNIINRIERLESHELSLNGLKLSLLGDSISAYAGTIPTGNDAYYTGSNSGVSSPDQMWWKVLCDKTGMQPLVINGWSGSAITQLTDSTHQTKVPMSDTSRDQALHSSTANPDLVIVAGGVNDYSYAQQTSQIPNNWEGKTAPVKGNSFTETYACMIKDIQTAYPNAIVVCLSTWFTMRGTDNGFTLLNGEGYTQADYDAEIEKVARIMRVPYINVEKCGFSRSNFYPTYAQDSSTIPTHPNERGQRVMGEYLADILPQLVHSFTSNTPE